RRLTLEPERYTGVSSYEEALARFESDPRIRILFENGAGNPAVPGAPVPSFEATFDQWPIPTTQATRWYFGPEATLTSAAPVEEGADSYEYDTSRSQQTTVVGPDNEVWKAMPAWNWQPLEAGKAVAYATEPLSQTLVMAGSGSVDLWFASTAPDVDVQVTLTEIRPDGNEVLVQSGWLRASQRKPNEALSTPLRPQHTHFEADVEPLPQGELVPMRVELFPFAHVFRAGSRLRIAVDTPGGTRPRWKFRVTEYEEQVINTVARSAAMPSKVVLPVIPGLTPPEAYPPCPGLRGQPCRPYQEWSNTAAP
ncbi:MAG TPA: CocE/NonD family hydrolase, partial [Terriglobales bacterium]|nr:CocE/NonD family hydrolase [Terriglobales bacterium]